MKVSEVNVKNFKRFTKLSITGIPEEAKLIILVGPNGCGKSSLFDAFNSWYKTHTVSGHSNDQSYYMKEEVEGFNTKKNINIAFHGLNKAPNKKEIMCFRTAYRNDPDFTITNIIKPPQELKIQRFIDNDKAVSENYQRLILNTMMELYSEDNNEKTVKELREELIGKIRKSMINVFDDLILNNIGDPLEAGSFYFKKGTIESYHYKNLSGGEKAAFDLLLDFIIKVETHKDSVFFIDEPETHMHTSLQGKLVKELYKIVSENGQLWIATHSFGIMNMGRKLSQENPKSVVFLDFTGLDFDEDVNLSPSSIDSVLWEKLLSITLDDFDGNHSKEFIVFCEGDVNGKKRRNFDARIYSKIFGHRYPQITFISGGSCTDIEKDDHLGIALLKWRRAWKTGPRGARKTRPPMPKE
ncbi:MAG: AAA family ATPase [Elusimicrobia bacterium]|nr:AAA family ATPase [Elusimicrobiota bacterium]